MTRVAVWLHKEKQKENLHQSTAACVVNSIWKPVAERQLKEWQKAEVRQVELIAAISEQAELINDLNAIADKALTDIDVLGKDCCPTPYKSSHAGNMSLTSEVLLTSARR